MKKLFYLLFISSVVLVSCKKEYQCKCIKITNSYYSYAGGTSSFDNPSVVSNPDVIESDNQYVNNTTMAKAEEDCNSFNYENETITYTGDSSWNTLAETYSCQLE